uniref:N-acetyltransferase domain-containing protein n=1 Tax=uncultured Candidatus Melainabacteria bacterium TaxID=2682970 RepID=A0A650EJT1_9BACT|nr:hypothetical protein Melaina855_2130 [uncultured Candidatus Melainabacteria bacterium]
MNISFGLKYPPLRYITKQKIPDKLFYHKSLKLIENSDILLDEFIVFSTKNPSEYAKMRCFKTEIERDNLKHVPSLYIWTLHSSSSGQGLGTALLHFAKMYSEELGCKGFFHLSADVSWMPNKVPHIFYRKFGMSTVDSCIDSKLDKFIKKHKTASYKDFNTVDMYYPPIQHQKGSFVSAIKELFGLK